MIYIVFAKIGNVLKHLKHAWVNCYIIALNNVSNTCYLISIFVDNLLNRSVIINDLSQLLGSGEHSILC